MSQEQLALGCSVTLVGNIASGKTTLGCLLEERLPGICKLISEEPGDYPFITLAFTDPLRWSCINQLDFILTKARQEAAGVPLGKIVIREMDCVATHEIWSRALNSVGFMSAQEFDLTQRLFETLDRPRNVRAVAHVYLRTPPSVVLNRIGQRGRGFESVDAGLVRLVDALDCHLEDFVARHRNFRVLDTVAVNLLEVSTEREKVLADIVAEIRSYMHTQ